MMKKDGLLVLTAAVAIAIGAACSGSRKSVTTSATIGSSGGEIDTASGVSLVFPAGALSSDVLITITEHAGSAPSGYASVSDLYRFEPAGLVFSSPVMATFPVPSSAGYVDVFWSQLSGSGYDDLGGTLNNAKITVEVAHFSTAFLAAPCGCSSPSGSPTPGSSPTPTPTPTALNATAFGCSVPSPTPTGTSSATPTPTPLLAAFGCTAPTPTPTPSANTCAIIFESAAATPGKIHAYGITLPAAEWSNGTKALTLGSSSPGGQLQLDAIYAYFDYNFDTNLGTSDVSGIATSGSFTLSGIPATDPLVNGASFSFADSTDSAFFDEYLYPNSSYAQTATGGNGSIASGELSDFMTQGTPFDGSVVMNIQTSTLTTTLTIGGTGAAYAGCYTQ